MDRRSKKLIKKTKLKETYQRYDLEIEGTHNFVVCDVVVHNTNCRLGYLRKSGEVDRNFVAGSHNTVRKELDNNGNKSLYWLPYEWLPNLKKLMTEMADSNNGDIVVYGEIYGSGVQDMTYGLARGEKAFKVFDISINGDYLPWDAVVTLCLNYNIPFAHCVYRGEYSIEKIREITDGPTTVLDASLNPTMKFREGVVVRPIVERDGICGRVIAKSISVDYLSRKGGTDSH